MSDDNEIKLENVGEEVEIDVENFPMGKTGESRIWCHR